MMRLSFIIIGSFMLFACTKKNLEADPAVSKYLSDRIQSTEGENISFDTTLVFPWDKLLIVKPYITEEELFEYKHEIKNIDQLNFTDKRYNDGLNFLVLINQKKAVRLLELTIWPCCNFLYNRNNDNPILLNKKDAVFNIVKGIESKKITYTLKLIK
jgi:hypothetical protein